MVIILFCLISPVHNRSMAEEYTTTETESVISSRLDGNVFQFWNILVILGFCTQTHSVLFSSVFFCFIHEERNILPRSARVHREAYEKYDRFDGM